jgi:hypothetical protein
MYVVQEKVVFVDFSKDNKLWKLVVLICEFAEMM